MMLAFLFSFFKKNHLALLSLAFCSVSFVSCQSTTNRKRECQNLNWRDFGKQTALAGQESESTYLSKLKYCKKSSHPLKHEAYLEGYSRGRAFFCTTSKGFDYGMKGKVYSSTCDESSEPLFLRGYYKGRLQHLGEELKKYSQLYSEAEDRLWRKEREYTIVLSEDAEQAKLEMSTIDAYREEARHLGERKQRIEKEILQTKRLVEESLF